MTIPNTTRKAGPLLGTGSQTTWPFTFKVFAAGDVQVTIANSSGTETLLVLGTDYTVTLNSNQDTSPGGTVNYPISGAALPVGSVLAIIGDLDYDQPLDLPSGGNFSPTALENQLDRSTMQIQQLREEMNRTAKLPPTSSESVEALVDDLQRIADSADNLDTVAGNIAAVNTVASDLNEPVSEINTVATSIANVNTVGNNISNVNTVAGISANVTTVAGIQANVTTVAGIAANVTAVAGNATNINTVAGNNANVTAVGANITNVNTVAANEVNIDTVAGIASNVSAVAAIDDAVSIAATNVADINNFADVYQGGKTSDPTVRNDGSALQAGDLYFNTTLGRMRVRVFGVWDDAITNVGAFDVETFNGTGSQTAFTLGTDPLDKANCQIYISGVYQQKIKYDVVGTTLTFTTAPPAGTDNIEVVISTPTAFGNLSAIQVDVTAKSATATAQAGIATTQAGIATAQAGIATTQAGLAATAGGAAEAARDAATVNANVYTSTASAQSDAGLAVGAQYQVLSGAELIRYRKDSSSASTELVRFVLNNTDHLTPIIASATTPPYIPNFDQATQVLTLYADTLILPPRGTQNYVVGSTVNIDTTNGGALVTSARKVYWRSDTNGFEVKAWNTALTYSETLTHNLIATIRRVATATTPGATRISMACPVTVDRIASTNQPGVLCPIILPALAGFLPNLDTVANTLYMPDDIVIKAPGLADGKNGSYAITTGSSTINLAAVVSTAKAVFYSISGGNYVVKEHGQALTGAETSDLLLVAVVRRSASSGHSLSMNCPCTVDGVSQLAGLDEKQTEWAAIFTPLGGTPTPTRNLPEYNSATKVLTFYQDTILRSGNKQWVLAAKTDVTIGSGSSAHRVFWNTATNAFVVRAWSNNLTRTEAASFVLVAAIRDGSAANVPPVISMMCPYTVDGKLLGYIPEYATSGAENRAGAALEGIHHRGFSANAPENTLAAYKASAAARNHTVEGDIQWTSDNVAVLLHDSTIDRTSNGTGAVVGMTLATAKTYDFGTWKGVAFANERIPTWDEYLILAKKLDLYGYFEIKTDATLAQVQGLLAAIEKAGMKGRVQLDSFYFSVLQKVVAEDPTQDVGYLVGALTDANWTAAIATAVANFQTGSNRVAIEPPLTNLTKARVEEAHQAGLRVVVYTINSTAEVATLANMGVDGIMTDALNIAQVVRASEGL